ncbi:acyl carrier protein [Streptomyces sp. NPDC002784]
MRYAVEDVRETVLGIIEQLSPEPERFDPAKDLHLVNDLGFHSLALLELAFAIEDDFDLPPIDEETGRGIQTTEQVLAYVIGQLDDQDELISS